ncbi:hypothetical protein GCM10017566_70690 [Amycolatopsis bartoniae]|uniref:Abortive infection protein n=2 Tax=Amycolatopsis bartoniae TaxID=941986 RepID=A0A8H9J3C1_9PSEU|nr:hypothetical protein GCM10017566_70690 [Amycolatopsis bartoniae]
MKRKGVIYDVGSVQMGINWRPDYRPEVVRRELRILAEDLHCGAVKIRGRDISRVVLTGDAAAAFGMEVWLSAELFGQPPADTLSYIEAAAAAGEQLRRRWPDRVVFSVGTELTLFMRGMVPGRTYRQRVRHLKAAPRAARQDTPLRPFLAQAVDAARRHFDGPITYAAFPFERVDWDRFDIVGINHYWHRLIADRYVPMLRPWLELGKPVVISELGFRTCTGADEPRPVGQENAAAFGMLLQLLPGIGRLVHPRVKTIRERNEALQARRLTRQLETLDEAGIDGAFIYTFSFPLLPHHPDPRHDLDVDSFSLVKSLPRPQHGTTYPDMTWEPKQAFAAVANYYARR